MTFKLKKIHEPFGTRAEPQYEPTYSEGLLTVVDGLCEVALPETRDRLLKLGYVEVNQEAEAEIKNKALPSTLSSRAPVSRPQVVSKAKRLRR